METVALPAPRSTSVRRRFEILSDAGIPPSIALARAAEMAAFDIAARVRAGASIPDALDTLGSAYTNDIVKALGSPETIEDTAVFVGALFSILISDTVKDIPTPQCIQSHLPRDRRPTEEEVKAAWKKCSK